MCKKLFIYHFFDIEHLTLIQPYAVDHLARESMKSAANCVN